MNTDAPEAAGPNGAAKGDIKDGGRRAGAAPAGALAAAGLWLSLL